MGKTSLTLSGRDSVLFHTCTHARMHHIQSVTGVVVEEGAHDDQDDETVEKHKQLRWCTINSEELLRNLMVCACVRKRK